MSKTIGLWGPKGEVAPSRTQPDSHNGTKRNHKDQYMEQVTRRMKQEGITSPAGLIRLALTRARFTSNDVRKIRWGGIDALWGMILLVILQVVVSGFAIAVQVAQNPAGAEDSFDTMLTPGLMFVSAIAMYAAWGSSIMWASKVKGFGKLAKDFLVRFHWKHDIIFALIATVALRLLEQAVQFVVVNIFGLDIASSNNAGNIAEQQGIWWVINALIVAAILAPLFEELFFRGLFLQGLNRTLARTSRIRNSGRSNWLTKNSIVISLIISSTVFGFMHFPGSFDAGGIYLVTYTGVLGLLLGSLVLRYKRLGPSILTHIFFNLSGVILATLLQ